MRSKLDDVLISVGLGMLGTGLWIGKAPWVALVVVGTIVLALGLLAAKNMAGERVKGEAAKTGK